jgi:CelD/BcsL family acetyltransferase involved in cellulose biosynthesis
MVLISCAALERKECKLSELGQLGYIKLNGRGLATSSDTLCHDRLAVVLSSLAEGDTQRQSPGALLLRHQIVEASKAGLAYYDIGVGQVRQRTNGVTSSISCSTASSPSRRRVTF